jgi:hypothetical protein
MDSASFIDEFEIPQKRSVNQCFRRWHPPESVICSLFLGGRRPVKDWEGRARRSGWSACGFAIWDFRQLTGTGPYKLESLPADGVRPSPADQRLVAVHAVGAQAPSGEFDVGLARTGETMKVNFIGIIAAG